MTSDARKKTNKLKNRLRFYWASGTIPDRQILAEAADQIDELQRELHKWKRIASQAIPHNKIKDVYDAMEFYDDIR